MITVHLNIRREAGFSLDADLEIGPGVTALYGHSGAGKTTVLRFLSGLERGNKTDDVLITSNGTTWHSNNAYVPAHERHVAYVFQRPQLFPYLTVKGNLNYARKRARSQNAPSPSQVDEWLDLSPLHDKQADALSGGEAQRVAIGRALLSGASHLLLDEPLGSVDQRARWRILPYLGRLHRELDIPMVYVSHSLDEVNYLADHVYVLQSGRVVASGSVFDTSASLELATAEGENVAAVVQCSTSNYDAGYQLAEFSLGGQSLFISTEEVPEGDLRVRIPARDVSISLTRPTDTSILNVLEATIDDIETDERSALVRLQVGEQFFLARITRKSLTVLQLTKGQVVFAQIKGVALLTANVS